MISISPLQAVMWTFRRSERDVVNLYNSLSPVMQLATGGSMLNFGYWDGARDPVAAQRSLCALVGDMAELASAKVVVDAGSGLGAPAMQWKETHDLNIVCVNINRGQLASSAGRGSGILFVNATCTALPLSDRSADRIVALESAQHFRPIERFISESGRVLKKDGLLVMALPVMKRDEGHLKAASKLGILSLTWSSEHYGLERVKAAVERGGFAIRDVRHVGHQVYEPLADYYAKNRQSIKRSILTEYSLFVEGVLYRSLLKMKEASEREVIDYVIIKASQPV